MPKENKATFFEFDDHQIDFVEFDVDNVEQENSLEAIMPVRDVGVVKLRGTAKHKEYMRKEKAQEVLTELPGDDESLHIISNGAFDFFMFIPIAISLLGVCDEGYFSTWTMNRSNALALLDLYDTGRLKKISLLTGLYFKRRESAVYATIAEGMKKRKQRYIAFKNHTKIVLLKRDEKHIIIESSANFTGNPRLESYVITGSKELYNFHKKWMNGAFE